MRQRGLTIVEFLVAGAIMLFVSAGTLTLVTRAWQNHDAILTQNQVQREARAAMDMATDYIRNLAPWDQSKVAYADADGSIIGRTATQTLRRAGTTNYLVREGRPRVANITQFKITYQMREPADDGTLRWSAPFELNNRTGSYDPRILSVKTAFITVTASRRGLDGVLYSSTLTGSVAIRNQFHQLAPPI